jgi:hypothetical protein
MTRRSISCPPRLAAPASLPRDIAKAVGAVENKDVDRKDMPAELRDELRRRYRDAIEGRPSR